MDTVDGCIRINADRQTACVESPDRGKAIERLIGKRPHGAAVLGTTCVSPDAAIQSAEKEGIQVLKTVNGRCLAFAPELGDLVVEFIA